MVRSISRNPVCSSTNKRFSLHIFAGRRSVHAGCKLSTDSPPSSIRRTVPGTLPGTTATTTGANDGDRASPKIRFRHRGQLRPFDGTTSPGPVSHVRDTRDDQDRVYQRQYNKVSIPFSLLRGVRPEELTKISHKSAWAAGLCLASCLCAWIPFVVDATKDVNHYCDHCKVLLATWHRSGRTEVNRDHMLRDRLPQMSQERGTVSGRP